MEQTAGSGGLVLAIALAVVTVAALALGIWVAIQIHRNKKRTKLLVWVAYIAALVVLVGINAVAWRLNNVLGIWASGFTAETHAMKDAVQASLTANKTLEEEGVVLLENRNQTLPLDPKTTKLNLFGLASVDSKYSTRSMHRTTETNPNVIPLRTGLANSGFEVNPELVKFYKPKVPFVPPPNIFALGGDKGEIAEVPMKDYPEDLLKQAQDYSPVAVVVLGRQGGEGGDLRLDMKDHGGDTGAHYLKLQSSEAELVAWVKAHFQKVIVLVNTANAMELGWTQDPQIGAVLWVGQPGDSGFDAVGKILAGVVNPSGRLVDTWAYDPTSAPAYLNFGDFAYSNSDHKTKGFDGSEQMAHESFVDYAEGIYVGYRYYETRWVDNKTGRVDEAAYQKAVQYPFGYGQSYTTFAQKIGAFQSDAQSLKVSVQVTNTGKLAGKEVVQIYSAPPYIPGGIEKSRVVLIGFAKTDLLAPGASQTVEVSFPVESLASYDEHGHKAWVLDAGTYHIQLQANAHAVLDSRDYVVAATVVYDQKHPRTSDRVAATNRFDDVSHGDSVAYVSRSDWNKTLPKARAQAKPATPAQLQAINDTSVTPVPVTSDIVVAQHGLFLKDLRGLGYDDPKWTQFLEQVTVDQMKELIGFGGWTTHGFPALGIPSSNCVDGPSGLDNYVNGLAGSGFAAPIVTASTWNTVLAQSVAKVYGQEAKAFGYDGLYGPGMNLHRTAFSGRNFEYYSEDGLLSGKMAAAHVKGFSEEGLFVHIKHFAVNDQETNRQGVATWLNEQSLRELYLRPFEIAVKEGGATGVMGSFNRIGTTWTGASRALNTEVLRNEWGFHGTVMTDFFIGGFFNPDRAVASGLDLMESTTGASPTDALTSTPAGRQALRTSTHNILYTIANSHAMDSKPNLSTDGWVVWALVLDVILVVLIAWWGLALTRLPKTSAVKTERKE